MTFTGTPTTPQSQATPISSSSRAAGAYGIAVFEATPAPPEATPPSVAFGNVIAGVNYVQSVLISNIGSADLTITQDSASGDGFGISGNSLPLTLAAGQSASFAVTFESMTSGGASGSVSITTNARGSLTTIGLSATIGAPTVELSADPSSVAFGNIATGTVATQNVTLTNIGNSTVNISSVAAGGVVFLVGGVVNSALAPGQSIVVPVNFDPTSAGVATGSLAVVSNAPQMQIGLSGTGATPGQYSIALDWSPSPSTVVGYCVYRGTGATPSLTKLSSAIVQATSYKDTSVVSGQTYTYAITAVDADNVESAPSTSVSVNMP